MRVLRPEVSHPSTTLSKVGSKSSRESLAMPASEAALAMTRPASSIAHARRFDVPQSTAIHATGPFMTFPIAMLTMLQWNYSDAIDPRGDVLVGPSRSTTATGPTRERFALRQKRTFASQPMGPGARQESNPWYVLG